MTPLEYALIAIIIVMIMALFSIAVQLMHERKISDNWKKSYRFLRDEVLNNDYYKLPPRGTDGKFMKVGKL